MLDDDKGDGNTEAKSEEGDIYIKLNVHTQDSALPLLQDRYS